ncbi:MAG TPA: hypothetical protein VGH64_02215 [Puia sp.]
MMYFFDNVFYHICRVYTNKKDNSPEASGVIILSLVQTFNIFTLLILYSFYFNNKSVVNKPLAVILVTGLCVLNYIRYIYKDSRNYSVLKEENKHLNGYVVVGYIIGSFFFFFGLAFFLGKSHM